MDNLLDQFFDLEKQICEAFGFEHSCRRFPFVDNREDYWGITYYSTGVPNKVCYSPEANNVGGEIDGGECYGAHVYTHRHFDKWVYRSEKYTMILMDTRQDLNIYLGIFDNSKEVKDFIDMYPDV